jgi:hypothetical protein
MAYSQSKLTLKKDQLAALSKFWLQFQETTTAFVNLNATKGYKETTFQVSILLKSVLDELEEKKSASSSPFSVPEADPAALNGAPHAEETYAAVLLNAEFLLIRLNPVLAEEDRCYNPFLRHWVNVVLRCQPPVLKALGSTRNPNSSDGEVPTVPDWWAAAQAARLQVIKCGLGLEASRAPASGKPC